MNNSSTTPLQIAQLLDFKEIIQILRTHNALDNRFSNGISYSDIILLTVDNSSEDSGDFLTKKEKIVLSKKNKQNAQKYLVDYGKNAILNASVVGILNSDFGIENHDVIGKDEYNCTTLMKVFFNSNQGNVYQ